MQILKIDHSPSFQELVSLGEVFGNYIKLVADVQQKILYGGAELHADLEKILLESGSKQENVWGGGIDTQNKTIDCRAVANIRPGYNRSIEILNPQIRQKFIKIVQQYFPKYHD
jgi:hypothetical protein